MNHVWNYYIPHSGGISRFIKSSQINACHCKMYANSRQLTCWWQVCDKSTNTRLCKCNDSRGVSCSAWQKSSYVAIVSQRLCLTPVLVMMNKQKKYLWQETQIYRFVFFCFSQQRISYMCSQAHKYIHWQAGQCKYYIFACHSKHYRT